MSTVRSNESKGGCRPSPWRGILILAEMAFLAAGFARGEDAPRRTEMFNGRDLAGWEGAPGWWTVEDGALTAESTADKPCSKANYLVWTGGQPADFELECEFKLSGQGNSGIQIRSERRPDFDMFGYQADMTGDGKLVGFIYHHRHGLVAERGEQVVLSGGKRRAERADDPVKLLDHYQAGEWNRYRIRCLGSAIEVWLNGVRMCRITDDHAAAARSGFIGLQMHPGPPMKVQFRNLQLTPLKPAGRGESRASNEPEP
jgi:hypothetical protein